VAAFTLDPQLALAVDCTPARDLPTWDESENLAYNTQLGKGPALYPMDRSTIGDPRLLAWLEDTARAAKLPYQLRQPGGGGTDASVIHRTAKGIPSVSVSDPCRYPHSAASMVRLDGWRNTVALLHTALARLTPMILNRSGEAPEPLIPAAMTSHDRRKESGLGFRKAHRSRKAHAC
jgi:putative aminopeptidase FrvX